MLIPPNSRHDVIKLEFKPLKIGGNPEAAENASN